ncbi:unnamed protein product [Clonostachys rosea f. rosea IK726]|uniref:Uncharacterized protein n=1 Tax=Clonostachys rosea f. rosea IK726 TaxID=1349383 RepID=A0ACA9TFC1_BIOOC|nr:unnamed protein product [Clonostachys rosea f. rosea IK726]
MKVRRAANAGGGSVSPKVAFVPDLETAILCALAIKVDAVRSLFDRDRGAGQIKSRMIVGLWCSTIDNPKSDNESEGVSRGSGKRPVRDTNSSSEVYDICAHFPKTYQGDIIITTRPSMIKF